MALTEKIKESSGEGKTPITYMLIASHHSGRGKEFVGSGATNFDVAGFVRQHKNIAPTYNRAKNKKGPLKCWFARYSFIYFSGCNTQSSAKLFSEEVLRTGSTIYGTNCSVVTGATKLKTKHSPTIRDKRRNIQEDYFIDAADSQIWESFKGKK